MKVRAYVISERTRCQSAIPLIAPKHIVANPKCRRQLNDGIGSVGRLIMSIAPMHNNSDEIRSIAGITFVA